MDYGAYVYWAVRLFLVVLHGDAAAARDAHDSHVDESAVDEHPRLPHQQRENPLD